ncbi:MAG: ABATE domain-containing protein [Ktedonobacteraceae bacterium]
MKGAEVVAAEDKRGQDDGRFLFVGEVLALDLVNTEEVVRGKRHDRLETEQDARDWWQDVRAYYPEIDAVHAQHTHPLLDLAQSGDTDLLAALKVLRSALRHISAALVAGDVPTDVDLRVLNDVLQAGYRMLETTEAGNLRAVYYSHDRAHGHILLPIALSALHLIQESERHRLHKCGNERCILYFYDTTKSATRRWCSLGCMDRARSMQRYRRAKERNAVTE